MLVKVNVDICIKCNYGNCHFFVRMFRPGKSGKKCFKWPEVANIPCVFTFRFQTKQIGSERKHNRKLKGKKKKGALWLCLCLFKSCFHGEISALKLALVLFSQVKTTFNRCGHQVTSKVLWLGSFDRRVCRFLFLTVLQLSPQIWSTGRKKSDHPP